MIAPIDIRPLLSNPCERRMVIQAKARTRTETQNGIETMRRASFALSAAHVDHAECDDIGDHHRDQGGADRDDKRRLDDPATARLVNRRS